MMMTREDDSGDAYDDDYILMKIYMLDLTVCVLRPFFAQNARSGGKGRAGRTAREKRILKGQRKSRKNSTRKTHT